MINPAFGLDQAVPYALLKICGRLPEKTWMRLEGDLEAAIRHEIIPDCLTGERILAIERMVREPIGYAVIERAA